MSSNVTIAVIGAGVVGLAVAAELASPGREVYVLEKEKTFGLGVSSRQSGVIHSGIYCPGGSLKAQLCVAGNRALYDLCREWKIDHRWLGKLIVATTEAERAQIEALQEQGLANGVTDLLLLSREEFQRLEPNVFGVAALLSPSTGVLDSHALMRAYLVRATANGVAMVYDTEVTGIRRCAGLDSERLAALAGIDTAGAGYRLHYCKGEYFSGGTRNARLVSRLIYPVPETSGLGIHTTFDLDGRMRLGPSVEYVDSPDYSVDERHRGRFCEAVKSYLPALDCGDIEPEMAGIRPKLQGPGDGFRDFVIREERDRGLPGLINLIGIESPGLTSSPAIAGYVAALVNEILSP
jgi:L-2-hydroxyglutarate oxidase LhgO